MSIVERARGLLLESRSTRVTESVGSPPVSDRWGRIKAGGRVFKIGTASAFPESATATRRPT